MPTRRRGFSARESRRRRFVSERIHGLTAATSFPPTLLVPWRPHEAPSTRFPFRGASPTRSSSYAFPPSPSDSPLSPRLSPLAGMTNGTNLISLARTNGRTSGASLRLILIVDSRPTSPRGRRLKIVFARRILFASASPSVIFFGQKRDQPSLSSSRSAGREKDDLSRGR